MLHSPVLLWIATTITVSKSLIFYFRHQETEMLGLNLVLLS